MFAARRCVASAVRATVQRAATTAAAPAPAANSGGSGVGRKIAIGLGVVAGSVVVGAGLANSVLLGPTLRLARFTGIEIDFDDVQGSLFYPELRLEFSGLRIKRQMQGKDRDYAASFDIKFTKAQFVGLKIIDGVAHIDTVWGDGITGSVETAPWSPPLPPVVIRKLQVNRAQLSVRSWEQSSSVAVAVERLESGPEGFRLPEVPISLLGSQFRGLIDSTGAVSITPRREVIVKAMPIARLTPLVPPGNILEWLRDGTADIAVQTTWKDAFGAALEHATAEHPAFIDVTMRVVLRNFKINTDVNAMKSASGAQKLGALATAGLLAYLQRNSRELVLELPVRVPWESLAKAHANTKNADGDTKAKALAEVLMQAVAVALVTKAVGALAAKALEASEPKEPKQAPK